MKRAFPDTHIEVHERNRPEDTFGWGVVFSDETLGTLEDADPPSLQQVRASFRYWDEIETYYGGACVKSTGHGFCGLSRQRLLQILHELVSPFGSRSMVGHDFGTGPLFRQLFAARLIWVSLLRLPSMPGIEPVREFASSISLLK